jgi:hypothetical protein
MISRHFDNINAKQLKKESCPGNRPTSRFSPPPLDHCRRRKRGRSMDIYIAGLANLWSNSQQRDEDGDYADRGPEYRSIVRRALVIGILLAAGLAACI